jgi:hypothetical protein
MVRAGQQPSEHDFHAPTSERLRTRARDARFVEDEETERAALVSAALRD